MDENNMEMMPNMESREEREDREGDDRQPGYDPLMELQRATVVSKQLDIKDLLESIKKLLLGVIGVDENKEYIIDKSKQLANEKGTSAIMFEMNLGLSHPATLGYLSDEDIQREACDFEMNIPYKILLNKEDWGIDDKNREIICDALSRIYYLQLTRASKGATHKGITQVSVVREQVMSRDTPSEAQEQKKGFWEKVGFTKK